MTFRRTFSTRHTILVTIHMFLFFYGFVMQIPQPPVVPVPMVFVIANPLVSAFSSIKFRRICAFVIFVVTLVVSSHPFFKSRLSFSGKYEPEYILYRLLHRLYCICRASCGRANFSAAVFGGFLTSTYDRHLASNCAEGIS